jgi:hypothetical protein
MIDHQQRLLVTYDESELRNALGIRGWLDVLTLGFDAATLTDMHKTTESRAVHGVVAIRFTSSRSGALDADVWWSQTDLLPVKITTSEPKGPSVVRLVVTGIERSVNEALLKSPSTRFPAYREIGYADWLEGHNER